VLASEQGGKTTSGQALGVVLRPKDVTNYRARIGGKSQGITKVKARVHNYETGESDEVDVDVKS
jgi:hypothetical protein